MLADDSSEGEKRLVPMDQRIVAAGASLRELSTASTDSMGDIETLQKTAAARIAWPLNHIVETKLTEAQSLLSWVSSLCETLADELTEPGPSSQEHKGGQGWRVLSNRVEKDKMLKDKEAELRNEHAKRFPSTKVDPTDRLNRLRNTQSRQPTASTGHYTPSLKPIQEEKQRRSCHMDVPAGIYDRFNVTVSEDRIWSGDSQTCFSVVAFRTCEDFDLVVSTDKEWWGECWFAGVVRNTWSARQIASYEFDNIRRGDIPSSILVGWAAQYEFMEAYSSFSSPRDLDGFSMQRRQSKGLRLRMRHGIFTAAMVQFEEPSVCLHGTPEVRLPYNGFSPSQLGSVRPCLLLSPNTTVRYKFTLPVVRAANEDSLAHALAVDREAPKRRPVGQASTPQLADAVAKPPAPPRPFPPREAAELVEVSVKHKTTGKRQVVSVPATAVMGDVLGALADKLKNPAIMNEGFLVKPAQLGQSGPVEAYKFDELLDYRRRLLFLGPSLDPPGVSMQEQPARDEAAKRQYAAAKRAGQAEAICNTTAGATDKENEAASETARKATSMVISMLDEDEEVYRRAAARRAGMEKSAEVSEEAVHKEPKELDLELEMVRSAHKDKEEAYPKVATEPVRKDRDEEEDLAAALGAERKVRRDTERKVMETEEHQAKREANLKAEAEAARKAMEEEGMRAAVEAERKAKRDAERKAMEIEEHQAKRDAKRRREEAESKAKDKEAADRNATTEQAAFAAKEEAARLAKEEEECKEQVAEECEGKKEVDLAAIEGEERKAARAELLAKEAAERKALVEKAREARKEEEETKAREDAERKAKEEAERKAARAQRLAKEGLTHITGEEIESKALQDEDGARLDANKAADQAAPQSTSCEEANAKVADPAECSRNQEQKSKPASAWKRKFEFPLEKQDKPKDAPVDSNRLPEQASEDTPGVYVIVRPTKVSDSQCCGAAQVAALEAGQMVRVVEVKLLEEHKRLRARLEDPAGWISLRKTDDVSYRWAAKKAVRSQTRAGSSNEVRSRPDVPRLELPLPLEPWQEVNNMQASTASSSSVSSTSTSTSVLTSSRPSVSRVATEGPDSVAQSWCMEQTETESHEAEVSAQSAHASCATDQPAAASTEGTDSVAHSWCMEKEADASVDPESPATPKKGSDSMTQSWLLEQAVPFTPEPKRSRRFTDESTEVEETEGAIPETSESPASSEDCDDVTFEMLASSPSSSSASPLEDDEEQAKEEEEEEAGSASVSPAQGAVGDTSQGTDADEKEEVDAAAPPVQEQAKEEKEQGKDLAAARPRPTPLQQSSIEFSWQEAALSTTNSPQHSWEEVSTVTSISLSAMTSSEANDGTPVRLPSSAGSQCSWMPASTASSRSLSASTQRSTTQMQEAKPFLVDICSDTQSEHSRGGLDGVYGADWARADLKRAAEAAKHRRHGSRGRGEVRGRRTRVQSKGSSKVAKLESTLAATKETLAGMKEMVENLESELAALKAEAEAKKHEPAAASSASSSSGGSRRGGERRRKAPQSPDAQVAQQAGASNLKSTQAEFEASGR